MNIGKVTGSSPVRSTSNKIPRKRGFDLVRLILILILILHPHPSPPLRPIHHAQGGTVMPEAAHDFIRILSVHV